MKKTTGVLKTTILGGVLFLLPFAVVVFLIGQIAAILYPVVAKLQTLLPDGALSFGIVSGATVLATVLVIVACYLAGLAARLSFASRFAEKIEKSLLLLFPRYAIWKNEMASNLGRQAGGSTMKPVLVQFDDAARVGFETERTPGGLVTVYLPTAPDPWSGHVVHVPADRVTPLAVEFGEAVKLCETMGRQASRVVASSATNPPLGPRSLTGG